MLFRHHPVESDYASMLAVRLGSVVHDKIDPRSSREYLPTEDSLRQSFPIKTIGDTGDLLLVEIDGILAGYAHTAWRWTEESGARVYLHLGYLLPQYRGCGIGSSMLEWSQAQIRTIAEKDGAGAEASFATNASTTEREAQALITDDGYSIKRTLSDMVAPAITGRIRSLPAGITTRPIEPAQHRKIYEAMRNAYAGMPINIPISDADFAEWLADYVRPANYNPLLWQVAWDGEEVAGLVIGRMQTGVGQICEVAVLPQWRRCGLGSALVTADIHQLALAGADQIRLFTDADDGMGARSLYEALGFAEMKKHVLYRKPLF